MSPVFAKSLNAICVWIDQTPLSQAIQATSWVVPTVQTVHILAIAVVASSALMIDLRLLGVFWADRPMKVVFSRFLPLVWWPLLILFATGLSQFFRRQDGTHGDLGSAPRLLPVAIAVVSTLLWSATTFAGRWVAS